MHYSLGQVLDFLYRVVVLSVLGLYVRSYLSEKAKNLATKQDIEDITEKIENIKARFTERGGLRLALVDRRMQAHQEAYALWWRLKSAVYKPDLINDVTRECQDWWVNNCLYLEPAVREAFRLAFLAASSHALLVETRSEMTDIRTSWATIIAPGRLIVESVELPAIAADLEIPPPPHTVG